MNNSTEIINNEQGFVLVAALMMLMILLLLGLAATSTTTFELQIAGNDRLSKQTFFKAEAVSREAVQILKNASEDPTIDMINMQDDPDLSLWVTQTPDAIGILTTGSGGTEGTDIRNDAIWTDHGQHSTSPLLTTSEMMAVYRGVAAGSSLDMGGSRLHDFDIYGRSKHHNSLAIIKVTTRISF